MLSCIRRKLVRHVLRWLLADVRLDSLHVERLRTGLNSLSMSADKLAWTTTTAAGALGELGMSVVSGKPNIFVAGSTVAITNANETGSLILFGATTVGTGTAEVFLLPGGFVAAADSATEYKIKASRAGTIKNLYVFHGVVGVGTDLITYTVKKNGVGTALVAALLPDAPGGADTSNSFTVTAGQAISVGVTKAGIITTSPLNVLITVEYTP